MSGLDTLHEEDYVPTLTSGPPDHILWVFHREVVTSGRDGRNSSECGVFLR